LLAVKLAFVPPLARERGKEGIWLVVARVPDVGKVTPVMPVKVKVEANAPDNVKAAAVETFPPIVIVEVPLFTPVPPRAGDKVPVHPSVMDVACNRAVAGVPPSVIVTLVSGVTVKAAGFTVGICEVVAKVPEVGNVTPVFPVSVPVKVKAPEKAVLPPRVKVLVPLFTPVPPEDGPRGIDDSVKPAKVGVLPSAIS
jgi:hypothetical protein